jgi:hypothetical protein
MEEQETRLILREHDDDDKKYQDRRKERGEIQRQRERKSKTTWFKFEATCRVF